MNDKKKGLYGKYHVERLDGSSCEGGKHFECEYFVLDLHHDKYAKIAILSYAASCEKEYPLLAKDLRRKFPDTTCAIIKDTDGDQE